ncbi:MAG TPA: AMP-binding protein [Jatrophihabitans sp.]|nr:AMP-binding protein [Jatrophihabitans sp.]
MLLDWLADPSTDRGLRLRGTDGWHFHSYRDLAADVHRVSATLRAAGAERGDVVSLVLADPWTFIASFWGTIAAGMIPSPLATPLAFRKADRYIAHLASVFGVARPAVVLTDAVLGEQVDAGAARSGIPGTIRRLDLTRPADPAEAAFEAPAAPVGPDELALLQFTSGSTGTPKGVRVTWSALNANVRAIRDWLGWTDQDTFASWLPLYHDMGLIGGMITPIASGTDLWLMTPDQFIRSPLTWLECFGRHGVTLTTAPSFGYAYTARRVTPAEIADFDFSAWRVAILGAERIEPAAISDFYHLAGPRNFDAGALIGAYGLAEVTLAATGVRPGAGSRLVRTKSTALSVGEEVVVAETARLGLDAVRGAGWMTGCGTALDGLSVAVIDDDGQPLPDGAFGEIRLTGSSLAHGYLLAGGELAPFGPDGLRTGDSGFQLAGELYVVGRIGESMKVRGASVHAEDLEVELAELPDLAKVRCAVAFGFLDAAHYAVVFVEEDVTPQWLTAATERVRTLTAGAAEPLVLRGRRGAIARTSSGKPRRRVMWTELVKGPETDWAVLHGEPPAGLHTA